MLKVLHITPMYPSREKPAFGTFIKTQVESLQGYVNIELLVLPGLGGLWPYIKSIPRIIRQLQNTYDIIHIHFGNASSLVKLLYFGKTPIVTSYCGNDLHGTLANDSHYVLKSIFYKKINILLAFRDAYSIVKSQSLGREILNRAKKIEIIPNGVCLKIFNPISKEQARKKIGIREDEKNVILFPANPDRPGKNFRFIEKVLAKFKSQHPYKLIAFNEGKVKPDLIPYYFYASDLVVFPSLSEGSPNVIKEAMACNSYIFSSDCGDVSWLLENVIGSRVLPLKEELWINALEDFFQGKISAQLLNGRDMLIKKGLDTDSIAKKILVIYNSIDAQSR